MSQVYLAETCVVTIEVIKTRVAKEDEARWDSMIWDEYSDRQMDNEGV